MYRRDYRLTGDPYNQNVSAEIHFQKIQEINFSSSVPFRVLNRFQIKKIKKCLFDWKIHDLLE